MFHADRVELDRSYGFVAPATWRNLSASCTKAGGALNQPQVVARLSRDLPAPQAAGRTRQRGAARQSRKRGTPQTVLTLLHYEHPEIKHDQLQPQSPCRVAGCPTLTNKRNIPKQRSGPFDAENRRSTGQARKPIQGFSILSSLVNCRRLLLACPASDERIGLSLRQKLDLFSSVAQTSDTPTPICRADAAGYVSSRSVGELFAGRGSLSVGNCLRHRNARRAECCGQRRIVYRVPCAVTGQDALVDRART